MADEEVQAGEGERASHQTTAIPADQIGGNTRFYEKEFPDPEDCVMVNVRAIAEMGAYVQLLEYNHIEGMILLSELSRRRIRSINKLIRVGRNEAAMVIRVDKDKGYIDLSKRRVSAEEVAKCDERFNKAKAVHSIVKHVSLKMKTPMASLYQRIAWPLYKRFPHAFDAFQAAVADPDSVFRGLDMTDGEKAVVCEYIATRMAPQPLKIRADVQVTCFAYEGIEAVRAALLAGQALSSEAVPIKVQLVAPPLYVMTTTCLDKAAGIAALTDAIAAVKAVIDAKGGQLAVKSAPAVTSVQLDEGELARMLEELEAAAAEDNSDEESAEEDDDEDDDEDGAAAPGDGKKGSGSSSKKADE